MAQSLHDTLKRVTDSIIARSEKTRAAYLAKLETARTLGDGRSQLACGNLAHAFAAVPSCDKARLAANKSPNLAIVSGYNDMLSAHQPYQTYPDAIKEVARKMGATAQVAGAIPAMCDGVTQGQRGMDLSLFSRDLIAMSTAVALSHNVFDSVLYLGVCDKVVPGLVIGALAFGHLPAVFLPAGPMPSGQSNDEKAKIRQDFAKGLVGRDALLKSEMASYHSPGTCTFYGTANSNQMLMEFMGLHLPGTSFINPNTALRDAVNEAAVQRAIEVSTLGDRGLPIAGILDERAFVNGIVGLNATGGSTNLLIHLIAMARAAGIQLSWEDFAEISEVTPLLARVYPNGLADVNQFHAAGGLGTVISNLLRAGLLHEDVQTIAGEGMARYTEEPSLNDDGKAIWRPCPKETSDDRIIRNAQTPFQTTGGLKRLCGSLGEAVMKVSSVSAERQVVKAPVRIFHTQEDVKAAFKDNAFTSDVIIVVRFQGPKANGMPELHGLTPVLGILQERGLKVALVTDGRMSGASGKVPAAIHVTPEALDGGPIAKLQDGDVVIIDARTGQLDVLSNDLRDRPNAEADLAADHVGMGRELFAMFRNSVGKASEGASVL